MGCYEVIEDDILRLIKESMNSMMILATFNSTFIELIQTKDNPISFEST